MIKVSSDNDTSDFTGTTGSQEMNG